MTGWIQTNPCQASQTHVYMYVCDWFIPCMGLNTELHSMFTVMWHIDVYCPHMTPRYLRFCSAADMFTVMWHIDVYCPYMTPRYLRFCSAADMFTVMWHIDVYCPRHRGGGGGGWAQWLNFVYFGIFCPLAGKPKLEFFCFLETIFVLWGTFI